MSNTNQNKTIFNIFKEAISIEIYGGEYYSIFSDLVLEKNVKTIFSRLSRDEMDHRGILEKEYKKSTGKSMDIGLLDKESRENARRVFPESLVETDITEVIDVLKIGIRTEERSIELYSSSVQKTDDKSGRELFLKLVKFEEGHKALLEDMKSHLEKEGSWYGYKKEG